MTKDSLVHSDSDSSHLHLEFLVWGGCLFLCFLVPLVFFSLPSFLSTFSLLFSAPPALWRGRGELRPLALLGGGCGILGKPSHSLSLDFFVWNTGRSQDGSESTVRGVCEDTPQSQAHGCPYLVAQSCLTLCDPMACSPPGSSVHGISQARALEWGAISFSRGSSPPRDQTCLSCIGRRVLHCRAPRDVTGRAGNKCWPLAQSPLHRFLYHLLGWEGAVIAVEGLGVAGEQDPTGRVPRGRRKPLKSHKLSQDVVRFQIWLLHRE